MLSSKTTFARQSLFTFLLLVSVLNSCKKDHLKYETSPNYSLKERGVDFTFIQDSLAANPVTLAFISELGVLEYDKSTFLALPGNFTWVQIPIIAPGSDAVDNILEVVTGPNGKIQYKIHNKLYLINCSLLPEYNFATNYINYNLDKFKALEDNSGLQNLVVSYRFFEQIHFRLANGLEVIYDPNTGEVYLAGGGGLMGSINPVTGEFVPNEGCMFNWETMSVVAVWSNDSNLNNLLGDVISFEGNTGFHFLNQMAFTISFNLSFPNGSWGYGSGSGGNGSNETYGNYNVQYEDIHILRKAQIRILETYGLDLDINTLIQLFGIECILELGNRPLPQGLNYAESDCIEEVLAANPLQCFLEKINDFSAKYGIDLPVDVAMECELANPGCNGTGFEECAKQKVIEAFVVAPPTNPIPDLGARLNCFDVTGNNWSNHKVTLMVDQPKTNSNASFSFKDIVGHTWLMIEQEDPSGNILTLSVGLYPNALASVCSQIEGGVYNDDGGHKFDVSVSWDISPFTFNQLIYNMRNPNHPPLYNLSDMNCTTWALDHLSALGLQVPANPIHSLPFIELTGCDVNGLAPGQLGQDIRDNNYSPNEGGSKNLSGGVAPKSSCQ